MICYNKTYSSYKNKHMRDPDRMRDRRGRQSNV